MVSIPSFVLKIQKKAPSIKKRPFIIFYILQLNNVDRSGAFIALFDLKADRLSLSEALKAVTLDGFIMDENIVPFWPFDESEAFVSVEPLDSSLFHRYILSKK